MPADITPALIRAWSPQNVVLGGNDFGALEQDSVTFNVIGTVKDINAANSLAVVKRIPTNWESWLDLSALEFTRARMAEIIQEADAASMPVGEATELIEYSLVITFALGDGSTATATGTATVRPELTLGADVQNEASPPVRLDFVPDVATTGKLLTWAQATQ